MSFSGRIAMGVTDYVPIRRGKLHPPTIHVQRQQRFVFVSLLRRCCRLVPLGRAPADVRCAFVRRPIALIVDDASPGAAAHLDSSSS